MAKKRYSPKFKFQVVMEALSGEKTPGQIAKQYGVHPVTVGIWKRAFMEHRPELFSEDDPVKENVRWKLEAWECARHTLEEHRAEIRDHIVHQDLDPVFKSYRWVDQLLVKDRARVSYSLNGARGNTEMESFNSRFKTENRSLLLDAKTLKELEHMVGERMGYYNGERRHSTIGYRAPVEYIATQWQWS